MVKVDEVTVLGAEEEGSGMIKAHGETTDTKNSGLPRAGKSQGKTKKFSRSGKSQGKS